MKQYSFNIQEKQESLEVLNYQIRSCERCSLYAKRKPKLNEIELCGKLLDDEISIIQPEVIVPLGQYAARAVLTKFSSDSISPDSSNSRILFGKLLCINNQKIYPLNHPASLLYNPSYEADTIEKYKKLKNFL